MSERDERTIDVVLDSLDYEAPAIGGFTHQELITCFMITMIGSALIFIPIGEFMLGHYAFGIVGSVVLSGIITSAGSHRAYIAKQGRPSYMLWVDLKRHIQFRGILGVKLKFGFVGTTHWHTGRDNRKTK
ncbi:DUF3487 family protein [Vibrio sp. 1180_3]|uniref:DUF3487 family protein n=1 Tax=Vibrio sp. 1180_3 TaxID=2528832 RepID=UPI002406BEC6|nr:DUF3487 family protein [Vibrio sp. 1180_3]MDF9399129.1 DUF3487 family protein [Vibrio sp. 1180_3]